MREFKWHLYNKDEEPLCWENDEWESEKLIDFDTLEEAFKFWEYVNYYYPEVGRQIYGMKKQFIIMMVAMYPARKQRD